MFRLTADGPQHLAASAAPLTGAQSRPTENDERQSSHEYQQYVRAHFAWRPIRNACLVWLLAVLFYFVAWSPAQAGSGIAHGRLPAQFNPVVCYQLVHHTGRMIAWARWEEGFSLEKTRTGEFREGTPMWVVELIQGWISDAYEWRATDEQVRQWAEELGDASNLPHADQLNVHQTIAIWMRRIARQCDGQHA
jgi:hypothetical protein